MAELLTGWMIECLAEVVAHGAQFRAGPVMVRLAQLRAGPANGSLGTVQRRTRKWFAWCVWKK